MKKLLSIIISVILIFSCVSVAFAIDDKPIIIWSASDLMKVDSNLSASYILARDIDMAEVENFEPIGSEEHPFTGSFDGNGHAIKNLDIRTTYDVVNGDTPKVAALFETVKGGTIKNLIVSDLYLMVQVYGYTSSNNSTSAEAAGIAGVIYDGSIIENCSVSGTVAAMAVRFSYVRSSGIAICVNSTIRNCYVEAYVFGAAYAANTMTGGISAWNENSTISNCCFNGRFYSENTTGFNYAGGIAGSGGSNVSSCAVFSTDMQVGGNTTENGTLTTDIINGYGSSNNCVVSATTADLLPNKNANVINDSLVSNEATYSSRGWDFDNVWTINDGRPKLQNIPTYEYIKNENDVITISYNDTTFRFFDGILSISGTDSVVNPDLFNTPISDFAEDTKVIFISEDVPSVDENAFLGFKNVENLIITGNTQIKANAFADCSAVSIIYIDGNVSFEDNAFADNISADLFTTKDNSVNGILPSGITNHIISYNDGAVTVSGTLKIDAYAFFDLCSLICSSYNDVNEIKIDKFICNNLQFFFFNKETGFPEPIWDHTLTNADIKVKVPHNNDWNEISWNEFCDLGISDEIDNFCLTITSDEYEEIEDSEIEIKDENDPPSIFQRILKFITSLLNKLFKLFSKM